MLVTGSITHAFSLLNVFTGKLRLYGVSCISRVPKNPLFLTLVCRVENLTKPLENYKDIGFFKIYVSSVDLIFVKKGITAEDVLYNLKELNDFKGRVVESYVSGQLTAIGYSCYYWMSECGAEVDFIIQRERKVVPVKAKSAENIMAKSLSVYIQSYKPAYTLNLSAKDFGLEDGKKTSPLYAAFCL